jgi:uncharacterized protein
MPLSFEWDPHKARTNLAKHGISFEEAATLFSDPQALTIADPQHSASESRFITMGVSHRGQILVAVHTDRSHNIRIMSARRAGRKERLQYEKAAP